MGLVYIRNVKFSYYWVKLKRTASSVIASQHRVLMHDNYFYICSFQGAPLRPRRAPLTWAASCGLLSCFQLLLGSQSSNGDGGGGGGGGGDGDGGDNKYKPLHAAANVGALSVCQALIDAGYKVKT